MNVLVSGSAALMNVMSTGALPGCSAALLVGGGGVKDGEKTHGGDPGKGCRCLDSKNARLT